MPTINIFNSLAGNTMILSIGTTPAGMVEFYVADNGGEQFVVKDGNFNVIG